MIDARTIEKPPTVQVFIVEDHPIVRHGLKHLVEAEPDLTVCGEAETVSQACELLESIRPDVVLLDLRLQDGDGMNVIQHIQKRWVGVKIIVVSTCDAAAYGPPAIEAGAMGFVGKHEAIDQVIDAIRCVLAGRIFPGHEADGDRFHWFG